MVQRYLFLVKNTLKKGFETTKTDGFCEYESKNCENENEGGVI